MGLKKRIELPNGVTVSYHRITQILHTINHETWVTVASYTTQDKRNELLENESADIYVMEVPYLHEYDSLLDVVRAYKWLKTLDEFKDASDILEAVKEV